MSSTAYPVCRVCGASHAGREPHVWKAQVVPAAPVVAETKPVAVASGERPGSERRREYLRTYMKEYMRRRREKTD